MNTERSDAERVTSVQRLIRADAATLFSIIDDPSRHCQFDGSGTVVGAAGEPTHLQIGDRFGMRMRFGVPYRIQSEVVEYERDRLLAWAHFGGHRWRYELTPTDDGTMVVESFDWSTSFAPWMIELLGYPRRHRPAMARTLERLEALVNS